MRWLKWMTLALLFGLMLGNTASGQVEPPVASVEAPIRIEAESAFHWTEGSYEVVLLSGNCRLRQDDVSAVCRDAVLWIDRGEPHEDLPAKVIAYFENDVEILFARAGAKIRDQSWLGRFHTQSRIELPEMAPIAPQALPPLVQRGREARRWEREGAVRPAQFTQPGPGGELIAPPIGVPAGQPTANSVLITPRSSVRIQAESFPSPDPSETIVAINSGVRVVVSGIQNVEGIQTGTATLEADRIVVWTNQLSGLSFSGDNVAQSQVNGRWEVYLEDNIVFREGDRVIYADRMYYDVNRRTGVILNAEALTPVDDYEGLVRLKADVLQQLSETEFVAHGAAMTSSRMGVPRYWFQSGTIRFRDEQQLAVDPFTGQTAIDPQTNETAVEHEMLASSHNNFLYVGGFPVLYWPFMATDLRKPTFYVDQLQFKNDDIFGSQILVDWDVYQLLGIRNPYPGTEWTVSTDWLSKRGFAGGTNFEYAGDLFHGVPAPYQGFADAWGIYDRGVDNLGVNRRELLPEQRERGRILTNHRQWFSGGFQFTSEFGYISDRTFLEQYYDNEWDNLKDQTSGFELKRYNGHGAWSLSMSSRVNDFFTQTEWLPRFDHFLIGQSLFAGHVNWHAHSHAGYGRFKVGDPPSPENANEFASWSRLPWEMVPGNGVEGYHAATRHEIDVPLSLGPVKVVPYMLGELFGVGEDITGQQRTRAYGQAGIRTSLPIWSANPNVQSVLFNLNGLAHKISLDADLFWAESDQNLGNYVLYDPLDDDNVEAFRRRLAPVAPQFDSRSFALRSGMQNWVTAPVTEIADDLALFKAGIRQRWQTKRGLPGQERTIDWIVLDVEGTLFPDADRDNFGESLGLLNYDFRWHVGDRFTVLSDGYADMFSDGLRTFSLGGLVNRPERSQLYLGVRTIEGPISSSILNGSLSYRMSEKWILAAGASIDFGESGNLGESLAVTRIGESTLLRIGFNVDQIRDNVGISLAIEPRFLPGNRQGRVGGITIPPAGVFGLE